MRAKNRLMDEHPMAIRMVRRMGDSLLWEFDAGLCGYRELARFCQGYMNEIEILAEINGKVIGTAGIGRVGSQEKLKHRAEFGIGIDKEYWGLGIGHALTEACIECAETAGYAQLELGVTAENERALSLYQSEGFIEFGRNPKGLWSRKSGWQELVLMRRELFGGDQE